ncbi:cytochrome P450 [Mycobacterium sp. pW049]|uniref:cytochrome P450 n=1 Tax=[Mycobacterium] bulgaricum TaxID=3238985 RepID=UPI00351BB00B
MSIRPVVKFDHHSAEYAQDWRNALAGNRQKCPVTWTDAHEGFWLFTGYDDVADAARDWEHFSTDHDPSGEHNGARGITIPSPPYRAIPLEMDPPEFHLVRNLLNKDFSPGSSRAWLPWLTEVVEEQLDLVTPSGEMDLIYDLGAVVPGRFTMKFLGLSQDEWQRWALPFHDFMSPPDTEQFQVAITDLLTVADRLLEQVQDRRANPRDDYITYLTQSMVGDEPMTDQMASEICFLIVAGGVDTTTSLFGSAVEWLSRNPDARDRLIAEPELLDTAIEEFLRYFSPTQGNARTVTDDIVVAGQHIRKGDRVLLSWAGANHDPAEFACPHDVVLDRKPNRHTAFGVGIHRCLGSNIARVELKAMLTGVLTRLPDFHIDADRAKRYASIGITNGFLSLPATFTPTPPVGGHR